ncbi:MAG: SDR family NAD(P)-dependent oxidoreductase [Sulfuricurvum sp.]|nr:MAG: short-chain dehydrogenase [Thiotrichales bacterium 24-47-4]
MNKRVLITGGNKGIGLELTRLFLGLGYKVVAIARDFNTFEFISHPDVECIVFDLVNVEQIPTLIDEMGIVDILINNAGVMYSLPYDDYPQEKIDTLLKLNLSAPIKLIESVAKGMIQKGSGRIVNNASIAGQIGHPDVWYGISKAGLINATKSFSKIFGDTIIINAVAPSPVETDMLQVIPLERREAFLKNVISKRFATAQEVAKTILWLATESPEYINGSCIDINNGSFPR